MSRVVTQVGAGDEPLTYLALNRQIPRVGLRRTEMRVGYRVSSAQWKEPKRLRRAAGFRGIGISTRIAGPGIGQRLFAGTRDRRSPRRVVRNARVEKHVRHVVEQAVRGADGSLAVPERIPHDSQSWQEVLRAVVVLLIGRVARITGEEEAGGRSERRRRFGRRAHNSRKEVAHAECFNVIVGVALRKVGLKAKADIHAEAVCKTPGILNVESIVVRFVVVVERLALTVGIQLSRKEVRVS